MESGAPTSRAVRNPDAPIHEEQFQDFLKEMGCPKDLPEDEIIPFLRTVPSSVVAKAQETVFYSYNPSLRWAFQPVIDGEVIRRRPIDAWHQGLWHKVPIMTGFNGNEGSLYVNKKMAEPSEFTEFFKMLLPQLTEEDLATINKLYPDPATIPSSQYQEDRQGVGAQYKRIEAAYAHYAYVAPVRQTAHLASPQAPVYIYEWALESSIINGAGHGENMRYETMDPAPCNISATQKDLAGTLHAYVTSFICTGDPNGLVKSYADRPKWVSYDNAQPKIMIFGQDNKELVGGSVGLASELKDDVWAKEESDFWWSKVEISQQ
jgi:carboxylesterase type B